MQDGKADDEAVDVLYITSVTQHITNKIKLGGG